MPVRDELAASALTDLFFAEPGVGRCLVAPDGSVLRANEEWLRSTGFKLGDVLGAEIIDLLPDTRDHFVLYPHAEKEAIFRRVRDTGEPAFFKDKPFEFLDQPERGITYWDWSLVPVKGVAGNVIGLVFSLRETTKYKRAEEALRASEARFRTLFETMSEGFSLNEIICDSEGKPCDLRYLEVNPAFERHTGLHAANIVGRTTCELFPGAETEWFERYGKVALTGEPSHFEAQFGPLGKWFEVRAYRTEPGRFAVVFFDVTERKRADEALRGSEQRLRALADSMPQLAWTAQPDGYITWYNRRWYEYTGTSPQQMEGWGWQSVHDPATLPDVLCRWKESITTGTAFEMEFPLQGANGKFRRFLTRVFPLKDSGGNVTQWFGTNTDVTELVGAQETLSVVTRLYAVLSRVNEAIVRVRDEQSLYEEVCRIVAEEGQFPLVWVGLVNQREIAPTASWGRASEYLREIKVEVAGELGQGPTGTCVREDRPVINDDFGVNPSTWPWLQATMRHGLRASAAFPLHRGGDVIGALTFYAAKPGAFTDEQVKLLEALCADISYALDAMQHERLRTEAVRALRESEQSLREADRRKDEFLGMLSHELRNPLTPIRNSIYILEHADPTGEQAARARKVIGRQTEHLTRLVDDLLDVTRIARGKIQLRRSRLDLREVVLGAADDLRLMMDERGIAFRTVLSGAKVWADADGTRITQVIGNLLHNAAKFTRRGDEVILSLRALEGEAEIAVHDTGAGIDPSLLPHVFEAFVQGDRTLARTEGGLGLGLALVKGITEMHGGTVRVESAGTGKGAGFVVRLPLADAADVQEPLRRKIWGNNGGRRVLVVDDNRDAAESLAEIVEMLGHTAEVAYDGPSAIERARANPPDIVLCDIGLPGMSGYDVAKALRANTMNGMQLVAVSGYAQPEDLKAAAEAGFDRHVAKPVSSDDIEQLLG